MEEPAQPRPEDDSSARPAPFAPAAPPPLGLPKSGGALRGLGETFQAGGPTGTGSLRVPIPVSPCRGAEPTLALEYDSGKGHGAFGIGWSVSIPDISRRTDRGIPRYADATESDIFVLAGQEDLVLAGETEDGNYRVDAYRPRVEGLFARIERRTHKVTGDAHWRTITPDNVTSVFGLSPAARIANPANPLQVFRWLLEATFDSLGHATLFEYKAEDLTGVDPSDPSEATRFAHAPANAHLKRVHYGNRAPLTTRNPAYEELTAQSWLFQVVFDYGEHTTDLPQEVAPWALRPDPFSTFRAGFEIRTYRLCQRVLMFHEMPDQLGASDRLVKALELGYDASPTVTYLVSARGAGYAWNAANQITVAYTPTLKLDYTRLGALAPTVTAVDTDSLAQAPSGIDDVSYQLVDLDGEGIAGILESAARPAPALYYKRNLGRGKFARAEPLAFQPAPSTAGAQLLSLNGDGRLDVATLAGPTPGFYERTRDFAWSSFKPFASLPRLDWRARGVHFLDVDGDGLTDVLLAEDDVFVWYPSLSRDGFGAPNRITQAHDEDRGAVVLTTDDYETIFLADMTGDGLADIVRIRNGDIAYWPNLGYGRFGAKIAMKHAPQLDTPDLFDPRRIRLGDIDGTGVTDLVYLSRQGATIYLNQAGNSWSDASVIPLPIADTLASVRVADLLGTGTACLVWSSVDPADAGTPLRYVDLLRSAKPHLLTSVANGMGAQTAITYAPSTRYYLEDRAAGRPWATRLPFVVQTVARVEATDAVAATSCVYRYRYAHGFYDGVEREFRGFARVDAFDAEAMSSLHGAGSPPGALADDGGHYMLPPIHTVSWFHTGAWNGERDDLRAALRREYFAGDPLATPLPPNAVASGLLPPALRESYRALKGRLLRQEVYADDGSALAANPYAVTECRYEIRELQPIGTQRHGVYHPFERERVAYHYERNPADPRIEHQLALEVDPLGHVVRDAHVGYARRTAAEPEQGRVLATCGATTFAPPIATLYDFRHGVATESLHYELAIAPTSSVLAFAAVDTAMTASTTLPFDGTLAADTKRTLEHVRHQFWADDLSGPLPLGSVATRALPYDQFALALPATLLASIFGTTVTAAELLAAGYVSPDGDFWIHAGTTAYSAAAFYAPSNFTDPFGNTSRVVLDPLLLQVVEEHTSDLAAFDNVTTATLDYRVLAPSLVTDPNGNRSAAAFDELGMVTAVALMGRANANEGDTLADPTIKIEYDLLAWQAATPSPAYVRTLARREHGAANTGWLETYSYSDGSGHEVLKKVQAAAGSDGAARWIGSGRVVLDNKGNAIKTYEPYFAATPAYDAESAIATAAYCAILTYDPLSRLIRTDVADGTFSTVELGAWQQVAADANDNVLQSAWYADAISRPATDPLNRAAQLAAAHANTPATSSFDALGRPFLVVADNGPAGKLATRTALDIQGNALVVTDPLGNVVVTRRYDAAGRALQSIGSDTGTSLGISDGAGVPYRSSDARGFAHRVVYDRLHRPVQTWATPPSQPDILTDLVVYGEGLPGSNFRGHVYLQFDGSGVVSNDAYDFEGHVTSATRRVATDYTATPSWSALATVTDPSAVLAAAASLLDSDAFTTTSSFDALGHVTQATTPDSSVTDSTFDVGGRLASVSSALRGATNTTQIVASIDYDANGQRTAISSGSGLVSQYTYDLRNRRTLRIQSTRSSDGATLQDLNYTHDPVGNIVEVDDRAQESVYFSGAVTSGTQQFQYDAIYQLVHATGREQPGQVGFALGPDGYPEAPLSALPHRNDLQALVPYTEDYSYDAAANLIATKHTAGGSSWTRTQTITASTNRLATVSLPGDPVNGPFTGIFDHDAVGNMTRMPNLSAMSWDHAGKLAEADLGGGGSAYFTYDCSGQRVRKVVVRGAKRLERIYVGSYERYRELNASTAAVMLERESLHIGDGERRFVLVETKTVDTSVTGLVPTPLLRFELATQIHSVLVETDATGAVISYEEYYPYGSTSFRAGDADKRYRFAGGERDEETGMYCMGARCYAPWLGRWISPDPSGYTANLNRYCYTRNSPVELRDPTGLDPAVSAFVQAFQRELAQLGVRAPFSLTPAAADLVAGGAAVAPAAAADVAGATAVSTGGAAAGVSVGGETAATAGVPVAADAAPAVLVTAGAVVAVGGTVSWEYGMAEYGTIVPIKHPGLEILDQVPKPIHASKPLTGTSVAPAPATPTKQTPNNRQKPETINLDASTMEGATSLADPFLALAINIFLLDKHPVATKAAIEEFRTHGLVERAGAWEKFAAAFFLLEVEEIPNNPSARINNIPTTSKRATDRLGSVDKIVFGTGDTLHVRTMTGDKKAVRFIEYQLRNDPNPPPRTIVHDRARFSGR